MKMEKNGFLVDKEYLIKYGEELNKKLLSIENKIYDIYEVNKLLEENGYADSLII